MTNLLKKLCLHAGAWRLMAACALVLGMGAMPASAAYPPGIYTLRLMGLPAGLTVVFSTKLLACADATNFIDSGSVTMSSRAIQATDPGFELPGVSRTVYEGTVQPRFDVPGGGPGPCLGIEGSTHDLELRASVRTGTDPAQPTWREVYFLPRVMMNANLRFTQILEARSSFVLLPGQTGPVTITRDVEASVSVDNLNKIGTAAIRRPSLSIVGRPAPTFIYRELARFWLNDSGRTCINANFRTRCQGDAPTTPSGAIVHAGIELWPIVARTSGNGVPSNTSRALFKFKLPASFPVGKFNMVANADDTDAPFYLVNGVPTALDLLPWQSAVHDVFVQ
jgi:hypothetical protein